MTQEADALIRSWKSISTEIGQLIVGLYDEEMALMPGSEGMTLKEVVHHIVEANIIAASMIIAALGASGPTYDWSWLWPNREWTDRLGYNKVPIEPSLGTLTNLIEHISNLVSLNDDTLERVVRLFDTPGGETYTKTVREIIKMEIDHAKQHLDDVRANLKQ